MTLKEFLKMNINIKGIGVVVINSKSVLKRCDINSVPQDLVDKKVIGWAVEKEYQIIIEIGE